MELSALSKYRQHSGFFSMTMLLTEKAPLLPYHHQCQSPVKAPGGFCSLLLFMGFIPIIPNWQVSTSKSVSVTYSALFCAWTTCNIAAGLYIALSLDSPKGTKVIGIDCIVILKKPLSETLSIIRFCGKETLSIIAQQSHSTWRGAGKLERSGALMESKKTLFYLHAD